MSAEDVCAFPMQMRTLRERMKEMQSSHDAQVALVRGKYQSLRNRVQDYHEQLQAAIVTANDSPSIDTASLSSAVKAISLR